MMGDSYFRGLAQSLIDDAIALSQANKRTQLTFRCLGLQVEVKADALKSNWRILGDAQSAAKIEIAFGSNRAASNNDAYRRRDGVERHTGAGNKRLEQHIARARAQSVASRCRVQPCRDECLAGLNVAGDPLAQTALRLQRDKRGIGALFVALFQGRLDGSKLFCFH